MFLLVFNFLVFTYGVMLVSGNGSINLRQLVNPGVVSALIALLFGLTGWRLPSPVESALSSIGSINTPMAMMVIGSSLAHSDIRAAFSNPLPVIRVSLLLPGSSCRWSLSDSRSSFRSTACLRASA